MRTKGMKIKLAPSILSADFGFLAEEVARVEEAGADWIHLDVMDGHFVPNLTMGPAIVSALRRATELPLDVHLMIENPERYLTQFREAGADIITVHQEACPHLHRTVEQIRALGARPGVTVNPATPLDTLAEVIHAVDVVLIMSVNPGFGGQSFIAGSLSKVARARELIDRLGNGVVELEVDGGVDAANASSLAEAGATVLVAGSAVFRHSEGAVAGMHALSKALQGVHK